jgi:hypothetical protein
MDTDLSQQWSMLKMPSDLMARLQLNQELTEEAEPDNIASALPMRRYAIAASFVLCCLQAGFMASNQFAAQNSNKIMKFYCPALRAT